MYNEYINPYVTQSNSIVEMQKLFGIEAARNKIIIEMRNMMPGVSDKHYGVFADEMTTTGRVTSIEKSGIEQREKNNTLLHISNSHIIQYLETAAINNVTCSTTVGLSPSLMVGSTPSLCSNYNDILIDETYLKDNIVNMNNISDSL
jgi:DNA-directed RNA polymerase beta' subunit